MGANGSHNTASSFTQGAVDEATKQQVGSADFFRMLAENASDGILTIDENSTIVYANPAIERIFGYEPADLIGDSLLTLMPERFHDQHLAAIHRYVATGDRTLDWDNIELPGQHRNGHEIHLSISFREYDAASKHLFTGIIRDITEQKERERELERHTTILDTVGDAVYQLDLNGNFVAVNDVVVEMTGYSRDELIGESVSLLLDDDGIQKATTAIRDLLATDEPGVRTVELTIHTATGDVIPIEDRIALLRSNGQIAGTVGVARDISARKQREQELERQRDELQELNRINTVIRDLNQALVGATTRDEIEQTVCDRLAAAEPYLFAWIGTYHPSQQNIEPTVWAGADVKYEELHKFTVIGGEIEEGGGLAEKAMDSGTVTVVKNSPSLAATASENEQTLTRDVQSAAAIPLQYGDALYGVLYLATDRYNGFTDRELEVLNELGDTIGLAINSAESKKLLHADTAVELEFHLADRSIFFIDASEKLECTFELEGIVPAAANTFLYYVTITDASLEAVQDMSASDTTIKNVEILREYDDQALVLFHVAGSSAVRTLLEAGARVKTAVAENGSSAVTVEVAPDTDTQALVQAIQRAFPGAEVVAKREISQPMQTQREFRETLRERLTDKQRATLEAAYHGGYFARPRAISGSDLAASFDVTPSTFHHHLQTGLNKVLGTVFNTDSSD